jgi:hypothetical protein
VRMVEEVGQLGRGALERVVRATLVPIRRGNEFRVSTPQAPGWIDLYLNSSYQSRRTSNKLPQGPKS